VLEAKGHIRHRLEGQRYLWSPVEDAEKEGASLMVDVARTFFKGSRERAIAALMGMDEGPITDEEYARLKALIDAARLRGR
jgi:predicted transcriptional regulator